ncbi:hypothetical protein [Pyxidicoccus trucidator]|uniref:hypothetical protein n=1 Tax=Pyxidicoccus trucidator TaxID=2709662 RepID=UPI0013DA95D0|nr:hypothetical protein [Pyxidicoccus trucidator]
MSGKSIEIDDEQLGHLMECLLIQYKLHPESSTFVIVSDYWEKPAEDCRSFIYIQFSGVEEFARERGLNRAAQAFVEEYRTRDVVGATVFQAVKAFPEGEGGTRVEFWFGPAFGGVSFKCREYSAWIRVARARQKGTDWEYRDVTTGDVVDFYNPFGERH